MDIALDINAAKLFIVLVLPGLVSMQVYRMMMPARALDWGNAALEGLFYSVLNLILCLPLLVPIHLGDFCSLHPVWYYLAFAVVLLILPIVWPVVFIQLHKTRKFTKWLQLPYPTAWDFFFDQRPEIFVLVHLKSGEMIGGYYGAGSCASAYPHEGDIYIELVYTVNEDGTFGDVMPDTRGLLVRKDEYTHVEMFNLPNQKEDSE